MAAATATGGDGDSVGGGDDTTGTACRRYDGEAMGTATMTMRRRRRGKQWQPGKATTKPKVEAKPLPAHLPCHGLSGYDAHCWPLPSACVFVVVCVCVVCCCWFVVVCGRKIGIRREFVF